MRAKEFIIEAEEKKSWDYALRGEHEGQLNENGNDSIIAVNPKLEELAQACDNWFAMEYTSNDIQYILTSPHSKPYRKPSQGHHTLYRCIFPKDKAAEQERDTRGFISYATTLRGVEAFRKLSAPNEPYYIIEKQLKPADFILNFTSLYEMVMAEMGPRYDSESEVWMKRTPYYLSHTKDEIVTNRQPKKVTEVTMVPTVAKSKREHLDVMPNDGKPIPQGNESSYLGDLVADMGLGYQIWSWVSHGTVTYYVFDTATRTSQLGTTGRPYKTNRNSFVIHGVYSGPKNRYRAADLYAFLILDQGLTLVSDNKQSEGGYRVWQELEQRYGRQINIHGFDTRTNEPVNVTTQDEPDTHVARSDVKKAGPQMKKELGSISRDLRFVASAK